MTDLTAFIAGLPKAELHVHHVGSASPRIVAELAARSDGASPVPPDPDALAEYFAFRDFEHFIEVYLSVVDLITEPEDVRLLTYEVARDLARQQVRYAEVTVSPWSHTSRGIPAPAVCEAIEDARAAGLRSVPHAGETTGPGTVWDALEHLGAERIGHGISAVHDPDLVAHLVEHGIPLEVCPTSNVRTGAVASLDEHPLPRLVAAGVTVSINSDDPPMFGTTLNDEYAVAADLLELDAAGVADLAIAAVDASFMSSSDRTRMRAEIADHLAARD